MPRVFVFSSHGSMPMNDEPTLFAMPVCRLKHMSAPASAPLQVMGMKDNPTLKLKKVVSFLSPVDTFTTVNFGRPFCADLRCDAPYVGLVHTLSHYVKTGGIPHDVSKDALRQIVKQTMVEIRHDPRHADALLDGSKIRCHKKGRPITDLFLFDPSQAAPIVESVTMVDMQTGEIQDVHSKFGLVKKKKVSTMSHASGQRADHAAILQAAKSRAEYDLQILQQTHGADSYYVDMKTEHIKAIDDTLKCVLKESNFEYSPTMKKVYKGRIKLSDLLQIGISTGLIDPENDFVVIYACRVPDDGALGAQTSPRDSSDSERSVGGKKCKRSRNKTCKSRPS